MWWGFFLFSVFFGFAAWYFYYGLECFLNSGSLGRNPYTMHFPLLWEELLWILPGGARRKREYCAERECPDMVSELPGIPHFLLTHVMLMFGPALVYLTFRGLL